MLARFSHSVKASEPIVLHSDSASKFKVEIPVSENAELPIEVTDLGMLRIPVSAVHPLNDESPIVTILFKFISSIVNWSQSLKWLASIVVASSAMSQVHSLAYEKDSKKRKLSIIKVK